MRGKDQYYTCETQETEEAFAFAMLLVNVLLLIVIGAFAWLAHFVLAENNSLNAILRGGFLQ
jgi:fluoride ion exporter CrcB/FEX